MKKVAIMTWYQHKNYGTTLQALALQRVIENLGYSVEGIDYYSKGYFRDQSSNIFSDTIIFNIVNAKAWGI